MNSCAQHILRFGQWAKSGPLLFRLLFKWLRTTPVPGVWLSRARRSCSTKTTSGKLPVLPKVIGTFPVFSRDPLLSLFPFSLQLTDSQNWGAWQPPSSAKDTLYSHRKAAVRWKDDGKSKGVIHHVSQFTGLSHSPQSAEGFARLSAWDSLVNSCTWPFTSKKVCTCWYAFPQHVSCMSIACPWQVSGSIQIRVNNIFSQLLPLTWCSVPVWMTLVVSELHRRWPRMMMNASLGMKSYDEKWIWWFYTPFLLLLCFGPRLHATSVFIFNLFQTKGNECWKKNTYIAWESVWMHWH